MIKRFVNRKANQEKLNEEPLEVKQTIVLEKSDTTALIIAAFTTIFPFVVIIVGLLLAVMWILFT